MTIHHCYCGAVAEIGYPGEEGLRWFCSVYAPWQCAGCGPETNEDHYPTLENENDDA